MSFIKLVFGVASENEKANNITLYPIDCFNPISTGGGFNFFKVPGGRSAHPV